MSQSNDNPKTTRYQVEPPANELMAGFVACTAVYAGGGADTDARLYIGIRGDLTLFTRRAVYPIRAAHLTYLGRARLESDHSVYCGEVNGEALFSLEPVLITVPRGAWQVARDFALTLCGPTPNPIPPAPPCPDMTTIPVAELPVLWVGFNTLLEVR